MSTTLTTQPSDPMTLCAAIAKSGLCGAKTQEAAFALACIALAEDRDAASNPMAFMSALGRAARDYHIIEGKPSMRAEIMLSRFQQAGGKVKWIKYADDVCAATFSHPAGGEVTIEWTIQRAKDARIMQPPAPGKAPSQWYKQPRSMLRSRCITEGVRTVYPSALNGVSEPDEVREITELRTVSHTEKPAVVCLDAPQESVVSSKQLAAELHAKVAAIDKAEAQRLLSESERSSERFCQLADEWMTARQTVTPDEPIVLDGLGQDGALAE